jgi:hypothetical protein
MTENGKLYVAEQAWTCTPFEIASRLLEVESPTWLLPFLRLAGGEGEQAGSRVLSAPLLTAAGRLDPPRTKLEEVELGGEPTLAAGGKMCRHLLWRTAGFTALFRRLEGELSVIPRAAGAVLGLEGCFERPVLLEAVPNGELAGRRAAETAVRSLIGHLRSALEEPRLEEMLA